MKPEQEEIYYITGESRQVVDSSPHLEAFKDKGYEVLYLLDPVDELVVQSITEFEGKKLQSVGKGTVELGTKGGARARGKGSQGEGAGAQGPAGAAAAEASTTTSRRCASPAG